MNKVKKEKCASGSSETGEHIPVLGLAMLGWKSLHTLENTLKALQALPQELFSDKVIYFQEMSEDDRAMANKFGFRSEGNNKNLGIREGIKQAVQCCRAEVVLFLECDCLLIEPRESATEQIITAAKKIATGVLPVVRMRHIHEPGEDYDGVRKFSRYWPLLNEKKMTSRFFKFIRRGLRPSKATRLIGQAVVARPDASDVFPKWIKRICPSLYSVNSQTIPWTNQAIIVEKNWFLTFLIPYAEAHPTTRDVNGFPDLEKELNCSWWRNQNVLVGQSVPGLFTHYRVDRPSNDEKTFLRDCL